MKRVLIDVESYTGSPNIEGLHNLHQVSHLQ